MITKWLLLALVVYFALYFYQKEPPYRYDHVNWLEKAEQMRKMRYHGIEGMVCEGNVCWFYRDGKKCGL